MIATSRSTSLTLGSGLWRDIFEIPDRGDVNGITPLPATARIPFTVAVTACSRAKCPRITKRRLEAWNRPPCPSFRVPMILTVKESRGRDLIRSITRSSRLSRAKDDQKLVTGNVADRRWILRSSLGHAGRGMRVRVSPRRGAYLEDNAT